MEHQKILNLLDNKPNLPSMFLSKSWFETSDYLRGPHKILKQFQGTIALHLYCIILKVVTIKEYTQYLPGCPNIRVQPSS